jgi:hypothetical protein
MNSIASGSSARCIPWPGNPIGKANVWFTPQR